MAFRFPFSNLHELNLDWILKTVKDLSDRVDSLDTEVTDEIPQMQTDIETLQGEMPDKVNKTGDTLSGSLTYDGVYAILKNNNITDGVIPAVDTYGNSAVMFRDHDGNNVGRVTPYVDTNGNESVMVLSQRKINNNNIFNYLRVGVDSSGNAYIYVADAEAWRKALELGTNGAFPLTIEQGGTGQTGTSTIITNISDILTAEEGFTITAANFTYWGKVAMLYVQGTLDTSIGATSTVIATINSGKRPKLTADCSIGGFDQAASYSFIGSDGKISTRNLSAGSVRIKATYILV